MDYILEELERQRLAMELLLALPAPQPSAAAEQERETARRESLGLAKTEERGGRTRRIDRENGAAKAGGRGETYAAENHRRSVDGTTAAQRLRWKNRVEESAALHDNLVWTRTTGTVLRQSAQEFSMAVERDARRYDGGYRSY